MPKLGNTYFRYLDANDRDTVKKLFVKRNHTKIGNKCVENSNGDGEGFNDMAFYKRLLKIKGIQHVELAAIGILDFPTLQEIYSIYRVTLQDGSTEMYDSKGSCFEDPSSWGKQRRMLVFQRGEFLKGIIAHGQINAVNAVTAITFVTNMRQLRVSGYRSNGDDGWSLHLAKNVPGMKIIAFCGSSNFLRRANLPTPPPRPPPPPPADIRELFRELEQEREQIRDLARVPRRFIEGIGCYIVPFRWEARGTHVLIRQLVRRNRAQPTTTSKLATIMKALTTLHPDLFQHVMTFL